MLVAVVLALEPVGSCVLPASHGALAYAGALDPLRRVSPALASNLHDRPGIKPLTVGPVVGALREGRGPQLPPLPTGGVSLAPVAPHVLVDHLADEQRRVGVDGFVSYRGGRTACRGGSPVGRCG